MERSLIRRVPCPNQNGGGNEATAWSKKCVDEMGSLLDLALPCRPSATLLKERRPTEARPGRKAGTDRSSAIG
jgi:hypothetical protein